MWVGSEVNLLCASANEESAPLVNNAPLAVSRQCISMNFVVGQSPFVSEHSLFLILVTQVLPQSVSLSRCQCSLHGRCSSALSRWKVVCLSFACKSAAWLKPSVLRDQSLTCQRCCLMKHGVCTCSVSTSSHTQSGWSTETWQRTPDCATARAPWRIIMRSPSTPHLPHWLFEIQLMDLFGTEALVSILPRSLRAVGDGFSVFTYARFPTWTWRVL